MKKYFIMIIVIMSIFGASFLSCWKDVEYTDSEQTCFQYDKRSVDEYYNNTKYTIYKNEPINIINAKLFIPIPVPDESTIGNNPISEFLLYIGAIGLFICAFAVLLTRGYYRFIKKSSDNPLKGNKILIMFLSIFGIFIILGVYVF